MFRLRPGYLFGVSLLALLAAVLPYTALTGSSAPPLRCPSGGSKHRLAAKASQPAFVFGQEGGNIRPFQVTVMNDGSLTSTGPIALPSGAHLSATALNGLLKLADSEGFFSMPSSTECTGTNPDVAARYVSINTTSGSRRVRVHGGCSGPFNQLFAVFMSATGAAWGH